MPVASRQSARRSRALEILAARSLDTPLSLSASYVFGFFTDGPGVFSLGMTSALLRRPLPTLLPTETIRTGRRYGRFASTGGPGSPPNTRRQAGPDPSYRISWCSDGARMFANKPARWARFRYAGPTRQLG